MTEQEAIFKANFESYEEMISFAEWAVGSKSAQITDTPKLWNERHGHLMTISPTDKMAETLPLMVELWKKETKGSSEG